MISLIQQNDWFAFESFCSGKDATAAGTPLEVVLTFAYGSTRDWRPVRKDILQILDLLLLPQGGVAIARSEV